MVSRCVFGSVRFGSDLAGLPVGTSLSPEDSAGMRGFLRRRDNAFCAARYRQGGSEQTARSVIAGRGECDGKSFASD